LELGSVGYLALLNAQQAYQQAVITWVQAEINRYIDTAALFQALGGAIAPVTAMQQVIPAA
jgi:outer membrane protein TolC